MEIDWITVSAQIVNFLILVGLLRYFLYRPVMRAMEEREKKIAERMNEARRREGEAEAEAEGYADKRREIDREREAILAQAKDEAERERRQMIDEVRSEVDDVRRTWLRQAEAEKDDFLSDLRRESAEVIQAAMRKALRDLADTELEDRVVRAFITRLEGLEAQTREGLRPDAEPVVVATAFELDSSTRGRLTRVIHETIDEQADVRYEQRPELVCGIELSSGGQRLGWSLSGYLDDVSSRVGRSFEHAEPTEREGAEAC